MKKLKLRIVKKILLVVVLNVLTACSTTHLIHEPVGCLGRPELPQFTEEDLQGLSEKGYNKILDMAIRYNARIQAQCELNEAHDDIHSN